MTTPVARPRARTEQTRRPAAGNRVAVDLSARQLAFSTTGFHFLSSSSSSVANSFGVVVRGVSPPFSNRSL